MNNKLLRIMLSGATVMGLTFSSCEKDSISSNTDLTCDVCVTISGALMKETAGDGDGGTRVYSINPAQAKDPNFSVNVFDNGMSIKSSRTARLQASADGKFLYNIQYTGDDGGIFNKYAVIGGNRYLPDGPEVATASYVSASPRWLKAAEGIGVAVRASATTAYSGTNPNFVFTKQNVKADVITLDLNNPKITKTASFDLILSPEEVAENYYISRIDVPVINKAKNKVFIGAAVNKLIVDKFTIGTDGKPVFTNDRTAIKAFAKTLVLDYPSLENPVVLNSTQTRANTNGYRSTQQYVGTDGHVYQSTSGEGAGNGGSKILRISGQTNDYDNSYVFSLDQALGLTDTYIETWKYVGDGIGFVVYSLGAERKGGYVARVDLKSKTATKFDIPISEKLSLGQIQNILAIKDEVYIALAEVGKDGNIYIFNSKTSAMKIGAKLINKTGNQYIGIY